MKKIEAIIKRSSYPQIANQLASMGYAIIDKRNLEDSKISDKQSVSKVGSSGLRSIPLSKIELVVSEKDAREVITLISTKSGFSSNQGGKIFISEMEEIVDMETLEAVHDIETDGNRNLTKKLTLTTKPKIKRSRLVPLQKFTLIKLEKIYDDNEEKLQTYYRIKSFSDFVNHCIMGHLPTIEKQLKHETIVYGNNFREF